MNERYVNNEIARIFSDAYKLELWEKTELAVIKAKVNFSIVSQEIYNQISGILENNKIDIEWWKNQDKTIHHDLNAFLDERLRFIPKEFHQYWHQNITSYDTEEPAFARMLIDALDVVGGFYAELQQTLADMAIKYRYTVMNARTHGQEAEMQTLGAKLLTWLMDLNVAIELLETSRSNLDYSKLSGAIGKYGSLDPEIEKEALEILGFQPFYGATQIMPRILYAPIAQSLCNLVMVIDKIGNDIRLAARSGRPILQEPFGQMQKGSSAMPHKKNTIRTEQLEGMARMARGYMLMITENIRTWEERAIEQSSVERVAWPDILHVTAQAITVLDGVLKKLTVYPDNMLREIYESRGVYASSEVKEFLKQHLELSHEDIYRLTQLACFNVFEPSMTRLEIRATTPRSFTESGYRLRKIAAAKPEKIISIQNFIPAGNLRATAQLNITAKQVAIFNRALKTLFANKQALDKWDILFTPKFLLKHEAVLYKEILEVI